MRHRRADFPRLQSDSLVLGKTTEAELRQRVGDPFRESTEVKNGEAVKMLSYTYMTRASAATGRVMPSREQRFYLWRGMMVGHEFESSFDGEKTDFDVSKVQQIRKGEMTESAVVALFGSPTGFYTYPLLKDKGDRGLVYIYLEWKGGRGIPYFYRQFLLVTLDANNVVKDVQFSSTGRRSASTRETGRIERRRPEEFAASTTARDDDVACGRQRASPATPAPPR